MFSGNLAWQDAQGSYLVTPAHVLIIFPSQANGWGATIRIEGECGFWNTGGFGSTSNPPFDAMTIIDISNISPSNTTDEFYCSAQAPNSQGPALTMKNLFILTGNPANIGGISNAVNPIFNDIENVGVGPLGVSITSTNSSPYLLAPVNPSFGFFISGQASNWSWMNGIVVIGLYAGMMSRDWTHYGMLYIQSCVYGIIFASPPHMTLIDLLAIQGCKYNIANIGGPYIVQELIITQLDGEDYSGWSGEGSLPPGSYDTVYDVCQYGNNTNNYWITILSWSMYQDSTNAERAIKTDGSGTIRVLIGFPYAGNGAPAVRGMDNRRGVTTVDSSPITLYTVPAAGKLYKLNTRIMSKSGTSATYTLTWTEGGVVISKALTISAVDSDVDLSILIQPDSGTAITAQITTISASTVDVAASVEAISSAP
ncbi:MAG: hypothetical protein QXU98_01855 [Candidatus Parvarchaeota archaeon]